MDFGAVKGLAHLDPKPLKVLVYLPGRGFVHRVALSLH